MKLSCAFLASLALLAPTPANAITPSCKCLPTSACWPPPSAWSTFNATLQGTLIPTVPLGAVCHDPTYDDAACKGLRSSWTSPLTHLASSSSPMQPFFSNNSCNPFAANDGTPCELGNLVSYAVEVEPSSGQDDVRAAVRFARENNVRLVVRSTGHDYFGRSTGAGALSIWMKRYSSLSLSTWTKPTGNWEGKPVLTVGPGALGHEVLAFAKSHGKVVVMGTCPTVSLAGGFVQGGGHSILSTAFGLAADEALEFQVVTASGDLVVANERENADLFWALRGGGAGTFGVVTEVTVRARPDAKVGSGTIQFGIGGNESSFRDAVDYFHGLLPGMLADGRTTVAYRLAETFLAISPVTVYGGTRNDAVKILEPFVQRLGDLGIQYASSYSESHNFHDHYVRHFGPIPEGRFPVASYNLGGRLLPRDVLADPQKKERFNEVAHRLRRTGVTVSGMALNVSGGRDVDNAVHPAWRTAVVQLQLGTPWNDTNWGGMIEDQRKMTEEVIPMMKMATPGSGAYVNEADFNEPDWRQEFFGSNYQRLLSIKEKWDPDGLFYGLKLVGSEKWHVQPDGTMCRQPN